jgi:hypothetical protein
MFNIWFLLGNSYIFLIAIVKYWTVITAGSALVVALQIGTLLYVGLLVLAVVLWLLTLEHHSLAYVRRRKYMYC